VAGGLSAPSSGALRACQTHHLSRGVLIDASGILGQLMLSVNSYLTRNHSVNVAFVLVSLNLLSFFSLLSPYIDIRNGREHSSKTLLRLKYKFPSDLISFSFFAPFHFSVGFGSWLAFLQERGYLTEHADF